MKLEKQEAGKILLKALKEKLTLASDDIVRRFDEACSADYWRALNPQLNIGAEKPAEDFETTPLSDAEVTSTLKQLKKDGYFAMPRPIVRPEVTQKMLAAVDNLKKAGWHEVWAFVYDEFWRATRTPSSVRLFRQILGDDYTALPHVVVHYVHPGTGSGWSPHIDFSDRDHRFTVWFSIGNATVDNGCMHVISKRRVDNSLMEKWRKLEKLDHTEVKRLLHGTHALPVAPGSILGWEGDVIHWGGLSHETSEPRISISVVYLPEGVAPMKDEMPLLSPVDLPDFDKRLLCIGKAINYYKIHVLELNKFSELGKKLLYKYQESEQKQL